MRSVGVVIGWNENLHTLGPPGPELPTPALEQERRKQAFSHRLLDLTL